MTARHANWLFLAGFILLGVYYLYDSFQLASVASTGGLGVVQFPIALGLILIALCIAEFWHSSRSRDPEDNERIQIPNADKLVMTVVLAGLYYFVWAATGQFYATTAAFFFILVMMYQENRTLRSTATAATFSAAFTVALYLVFGLAFSIQLN